ncbi:MAG: hydroxymethylglutaryl-CoA lyase [Spirosomaceae bacterium]|nr:hydroxymethylglutaryl-CoA lyase [Spirosomataceae bacterium]
MPIILIEEQGPRDGFQVEKKPIPTEMKVRYVEALVEAGLQRIQITSFVHPKFVPQMADAEEVCSHVKKQDGVLYSGLVLNAKGVERAVRAGLNHVAASISASDTHSRKNANKSLEEAQTEFEEMLRVAKAEGLRVRGGVQCAFGCRYEGKISEKVVLELAKRHLDLGVDEIALADSTGMGNPDAIKRVMTQVVQWADGRPVALHLHDTEGKGMANMLAGIEAGVTIFDTAFGGLGGCPFIKGATGNIATEDAANMLHQMGVQTGIDLRRVAALSQEMETFLERKLPGRMKDVLQMDLAMI